MKRSSDVFPGLVNLTPERRVLLGQLLGINEGSIVAQGVQAFLLEGLLVFADLLMQTEVQALVGERYKHQQDRECTRWGSQDGQITALQQRVRLKKPRVRISGGGEVELATYKALSEEDMLNEKTAQKILCGLSTRRQGRVIEKFVRSAGLSRQTISRRAIQSMNASLTEFRSRRFDELDILTIFIDGVWLADVVHIAALGIDSNGKKHVLAIQEGPTESHHVCKDLLRSLLERGLSVDRSYLFVIDGSKALPKAIKEVFGGRCYVQRCLEHKKRNVEGRLPQEYRKTFRQKAEAAYAKPTLKEAEKAFEDLRRWLLLIKPSAADRLVDGLPQVLTLHQLGLGSKLRKTLCTTNCIESLFASARYYTRNVKRWHKEEQMQRWLAAGLLEAEKQLRRIPGYTQLKGLKQILTK